jgi:GT2 family glycosyltransferase
MTPHPPQQLLVVDNASTDQSLALIAELGIKCQEIAIIRSSRNLGYAGGVNLALPAVTGKYIAVLNMDVIVERGWLEPLLAFLDKNKKAGAVNPLITLADGSKINAAGQEVHISGLGFNRWLGRPAGVIAKTPVRVPGIQGAAFVTHRVLLERIGGMDVSGFLYHEDVNFSWLLRIMGYELYCVPESVVRHDYSLSMYPEKLYLLERNRLVMLLSYLHKSTLLCLTPALVLTETLMWVYCLLSGWSFSRAKLASYRWVFGRWKQIARRRRLTESMRAISDWHVLRKLRWSYAWGQFLVLGRERGRSKRRNVGPLPEQALDGRV